MYRVPNRAGFRRVPTVRLNWAADFKRPPFGGGKKLRVAKIFSSVALKLFDVDPSPRRKAV